MTIRDNTKQATLFTNDSGLELPSMSDPATDHDKHQDENGIVTTSRQKSPFAAIGSRNLDHGVMVLYT